MAKKREEREMGMFLDGIIDAMPLFAKELVAGGVAGGVAKTVVAPLERVKILFQVKMELYSLFSIDLNSDSWRLSTLWIVEHVWVPGIFFNFFFVSSISLMVLFRNYYD